MKSLGFLLSLVAGIGSSGCVSADDLLTPPRTGDTIPLTRTVDGGVEPWYAAETLDGESVTVESLRGSPVMLNLWATWCPPCRAEMPYFEEIHQRFSSRGLRVVGVSMDNSSALNQVHGFLEEAGVTYEIWHDAAMIGMDLFGVQGLPGTFLIDPAGTVTWARIGPVAEGDPAFETAVEELVTAGG